MRGRRILKAIRRGVAAGVMGHGKSPQHFAELTDPRLERIKRTLTPGNSVHCHSRCAVRGRDVE
jgi:hypothetical protein